MLGVPGLSEVWCTTRGAMPLGPDQEDLGCQSEVSALASLLSAWESGQGMPRWGGTPRAELQRSLKLGLSLPGQLRLKNSLGDTGLQPEA